jgi:DNA-binding FadR family transcriptional regulator
LKKVTDEPIEDQADADVEFHRGVARAAENPLYLVLLDSIRDVMVEVRVRNIEAFGWPAKAWAAHNRIFVAIETHDVPRARKAMGDHLRDAERSFRDLGSLRDVS